MASAAGLLIFLGLAACVMLIAFYHARTSK